jgi:hypothetical protein
MDSGFETHNLVKSLSNYPVVKGDVPGHAFHGNQYTNAPFSSSNPIIKNAKTIGEASSLLKQLNERIGYNNSQNLGIHPYNQNRMKGHIKLASAHREIGNALEKIGTPEARTAASAHFEAANAHDIAEKELNDLYDGDEEPNEHFDDDNYRSHYYRTSEVAQAYTDRADAITQDPVGDAKNGYQNPENGWPIAAPGVINPVESSL